MATPTLGNTPTTWDDAEATTGWAGTSLDVDSELKKQSNNSVYGILRNDLATIEHNITNDGGAATDLSGQHLRGWILFASVGLLDIEANNGMEFYVSDGTNTAYWVAFGSDTYSGGWFNLVLDVDSTPDSGTVNTASVTTWGFRFNRTAAPRQVDNTWIDYFHYGAGYSATGGTSGDKIDLTGVASQDDINAYGVLEKTNGVFFSRGRLTVGDGATTTWFNMTQEVLVFVDAPVASTLYGLVGTGSGCDIVIDASVVRGGGTTDLTRWTFDMSDATLAGVSITDSLFVRANTVTFDTGQTVTGNTFDDCGQITHGGATMNGSTIRGYEGTAGTAALLYNEIPDPDGEMDGMTFEKGTAATHAIEFGSNTPSSVTLRDCVYIGYNAANGNNDSTFYNNTGGALTINIVGGSGNVTYRNGAGASTTIVQNPVTLTVNTKKLSDQTALPTTRVLVFASDGTGPLPYQDSVTITHVTTTASVSHTAHGLSNGDKVLIIGANEDDYNGVFAISNVTANAYDYTMANDPGGNATGTITSTGVVIDGDTDGSGVISDTRTYASNQPITGRARKATTPPYYKTATITGTINSSSGLTLNVLLQED